MNFTQSEVQQLLNQGTASGAFPGAVAIWGSPRTGEAQICWAGLRGLTRDKIPVEPDLIYDLASLTKILSCTNLMMILEQKGLIDIDLPLAAYWPFLKQPWNRLTARHLLAHQSGLRPWRPFYLLGGHSKEQRRQIALRALAAEQAQAEMGQQSLYSDLNFIWLGFLMEEVSGKSLDSLFEEHLAAPLALKNTSYRPFATSLAPTEDGFRWGGPVGHAEAQIMGPTPLGRPHDDNCAWLGSVSGHAGLFGSAWEIWSLIRQWALAFQGEESLFSPKCLRAYLQIQPSALASGDRPLGFNLLKGQSAYEGSNWPPNTVGHTGYTGPALWWSPEDDFAWLLLCNRVHPRVGHPAWRPSLYQAGPKSAKP